MDAVNEALKEQNSSFVAKAVAADGLENCKAVLDKAMKPNLRDFNFIESMACTNGCIGGPCCLTHEFRDKSEVDKYGKEALEKTITDAIKVLKND